MADVRSKRASVRALGCRLNQYEAIEMEGRLKSSGYEIVSFGESAELGVINTCTVTNEADSKSRNVIRSMLIGSTEMAVSRMAGTGRRHGHAMELNRPPSECVQLPIICI